LLLRMTPINAVSGWKLGRDYLTLTFDWKARESAHASPGFLFQWAIHRIIGAVGKELQSGFHCLI